MDTGLIRKRTVGLHCNFLFVSKTNTISLFHTYIFKVHTRHPRVGSFQHENVRFNAQWSSPLRFETMAFTFEIRNLDFHLWDLKPWPSPLRLETTTFTFDIRNRRRLGLSYIDHTFHIKYNRCAICDVHWIRHSPPNFNRIWFQTRRCLTLCSIN